jgi:hypothetical protein
MMGIVLLCLGCEFMEDDASGGSGVATVTVLFPQATGYAQSALDVLLAQADRYALSVTKTGAEEPAYDRSDISPNAGSIDVPSLTADEYTFVWQAFATETETVVASDTTTVTLAAGNNQVVILLIPVDDEASRDIKVSWGGSADSAAKNIYFSEFAEVLTFINAENAPSNDYTVTLYTDKAAAPVDLSRSGTHITLTSGTPKTLSLTGKGSLFTVGSGVMLTLSGSIVLQGHDGNTAALVKIEKDGTFTMSGEAVISENSSTSSLGGGVYNQGNFTMSGGTISGNKATYYGGGVSNWWNFTMSGGTISGNEAVYGGGVYNFETFTMSDKAVIRENIAGFNGGGVFNTGPTFKMLGGTISKNIAGSNSGGVHNSRTFTMSGGTISGNKAGYCGGVYNVITEVIIDVVEPTQFSKEGGIIYGSTTEAGANANTATNEGGAAIVVYEFTPDKLKYKRSATAGVDDNLTGIDAGTGFWDGE